MKVDQGLLDRVWVRWLEKHHDAKKILYITKTYANVTRRTPVSKNFEEWLWQEGAMVRRENKCCYLHFFNDTDATAFILRNS